ncbi:sulfite exporter TauE/SafE family protein [Halieaceae bacterium IMCC14734]|uniref:Probable membrane transporter protein n=1 Tax=Candidatus Litorirhabdus singularis TaxID=2518993 RepID=A0ABT3TDE7_9GAMM|nr:sulfite exporter TauE/SafE family protein [Candidatus Litorirhabdus singularis]MCX2980332.1 sulfite exporter TauE/SafE family protein [Candidatus Litorirhabdus singularis]
MLTDPLFYLTAIPAVLLYGIAKGGFAGPAAVMAVPIMALFMSPTQAAAILLPILVVMDAQVVRTYWGHFDRRALRILLPGAMVGIALGYLSVGYMNDDHIRVVIGVLATAFGLQTLFGLRALSGSEHNPVTGSLFGTLAGFTSFSIHAGGPPVAMYLLPKGLSPLLFAGTSGMFFAVVNVVKLFPYYALDQLQLGNLTLSLVLMPLAPLGVAMGHFLVQRTDPTLYYRIISFLLVLVGLRLLTQGLG